MNATAKLLLSLLITTSYFCGAHAGDIEHHMLNEGGIVNNTADAIAYARQMCQIRYKNRFYCGCFFLTKQHVLTTAYCIRRIEQRVPEHERSSGSLSIQTNRYSYAQSALFKNYFRHPDYNNKTKEHDIAVVSLMKQIAFDSTTAMQMSFPIEVPPVDTLCYAYKWIMYSYMPKANVFPEPLKIAPAEKCAKFYDKMNNRICVSKTDSNITPCRGSTCGPLLCNGKWVGLSILDSLDSQKDNTYQIFTEILAYRDWIISTIREDFEQHYSLRGCSRTHSNRLNTILPILLIIARTFNL